MYEEEGAATDVPALGEYGAASDATEAPLGSYGAASTDDATRDGRVRRTVRGYDDSLFILSTAFLDRGGTVGPAFPFLATRVGCSAPGQPNDFCRIMTCGPCDSPKVK